MNVAAELIQTEGKVLTLARGRSGTRGTAAATASDGVSVGTGRAWEEGTASSNVANVAKNRIDRGLQVQKAA